jgi:hypothetical protein
MDSQDRDKSKSEQRREPLARRIGEALDEMDSRNAGECPDGEILAAYAESGLAVEETGKWESHFATCSRCRKILLVLNASADTPLAEKEVAHLGELAAATPGDAERTRPSSERARLWLADWRLRWLAPALGVAALLAVALVLRPPWRATQRAASETLVAQAPKPEQSLPPVPGEADRTSRAAPSQPQMQQAVPRDERSSATAAPSNSAVGGLAKGGAEVGVAADKAMPRAEEGIGSPQADKKLNAPQDKIEARAPSVSPPSTNSLGPQAVTPAPAAPPPPPRAVSNTAAAEAAQLDADANAIGNAASREKQAITAQEGPVPNAAGGSARPQISSEARLNERKEQAFTLVRPLQKDFSVLKAPSGSTLWRAGTGGSIERSTDGGRTWVFQVSPQQEDWLAGAAVSDTVCWLAGRHGAIARTVDGEHWERIAPPTPAGSNTALPDWTSVTALDSQTATITASDGRRFTTADGGKTWRPL